MAEFIETDDGVHIVSPIQGGEYTLCGEAFDAAGSEDDPTMEWRKTRRRSVSCGKCAAIIVECRGVRTSTAASGEGT